MAIFQNYLRWKKGRTRKNLKSANLHQIAILNFVRSHISWLNYFCQIAEFCEHIVQAITTSAWQFWPWTLTLTCQKLPVTFDTDAEQLCHVLHFSGNHNEQTNEWTDRQTRMIIIPPGVGKNVQLRVYWHWNKSAWWIRRFEEVFWADEEWQIYNNAPTSCHAPLPTNADSYFMSSTLCRLKYITGCIRHKNTLREGIKHGRKVLTCGKE